MALTQFGFQIGSSLATQYLTDSKYIRAGYTVVQTKADLDNLPVDSGSGGVTVKGSAAYVANDSTAANNGTYRYNGSAWVKENDVGISVPTNAVFTDTYLSGVSFADDTTNNSSSPLKITLARSGSITTSITGNLPKVSSSTAGIVPKGAAVSSQSQSTKFLREDGTWAAPTYTNNTNTTYSLSGAASGNTWVTTLTPSSGSATTSTVPAMGGATSAAAGSAGLVPKPAANKHEQFLRGDGTWANPKEAYLQWGGQNFSGSYGCIDAAMVDELGANRFMFLKAAGITIEYSKDGGSTWTDYGATDTQKVALFSSGQAFVVGKCTNTTEGRATVNDQLRVTINTSAAGIYTALNKFVFYISTSGSPAGCNVTIQRAIENAPNDYIDVATAVPISGYSGYNVVNVTAFTTYGNQTASQNGRVRFIFKTTGAATSSTGLQVSKIMGFGGVGWTTPSTMAKTGHLYSFNASQEATFPAKVTATGGFAGNLAGNATTATNLAGTTSPHYVYAGPASGSSSAAPAFRALVAADIPDLSSIYLTSFTETDPTVPAWAKAENKPTYTASEVGLGNVTNAAQITKATFTKAYQLIYSTAASTPAVLDANTTATKKFLRMTGSGSAGAAPAWDTVTKADVGLGNVENTALSTWAGSSNITTIGTLSSGTVPWARLSNVPSSFTPSSHTHGNIQNGGTLQTTDITIANGDKIIVTDASDSHKIARTSVAFDGSTETSVLSKKGTWVSLPTASSLGLSNAMHFIGTSTSTITDGGNQNPTVSGLSNYTKTVGDVILYGNQEFVYTAANKWELLGDEGSYKITQTAVTDPTANGSATAFIDTITQDTNGNIAVTKKEMYAAIFREWV